MENSRNLIKFRLRNKAFLLLLGIFLLAVTLRMARYLQENRKEPDTYAYLAMAKDWKNHGAEYAFSSYLGSYPPALVWFYTQSGRLGFDMLNAGIAIGILMGALMIYAAYFSAFYIFEKESVAILAALFVAIHPFLVRVSISGYREMFYFPLIAFAVMFAIRAIKMKSSWNWLLSSILLAIATTCRKEGIIFLGIFLIWFLLEPMFSRNFKAGNIAKNILNFVLVLIVFITIIFPIWISMPKSSTWNPLYLKSLDISEQSG